MSERLNRLYSLYFFIFQHVSQKQSAKLLFFAQITLNPPSFFCFFFMGTIYLLSPITVISLKAIDLNNRGWNVVTPSDRMLSIILAESEHLDNHEVLATEREPEGQAQSAQQSWRRLSIARATTKCSRPNGSPKGKRSAATSALHSACTRFGCATRCSLAAR